MSGETFQMVVLKIIEKIEMAVLLFIFYLFISFLVLLDARVLYKHRGFDRFME